MTNDPSPGSRKDLRVRLQTERDRFAFSPGFAAAEAALAAHLVGVLAQLEPACLGLYWPMRSEFNAPAAVTADTAATLALPFTRKSPREMHFRVWTGVAPTLRDESGIAACDGAVIVPDVVLAPCLGFTRDGYRLGYGGGYFDRWLAAHPQVTVVGVAWSVGALEGLGFTPEVHDRPLALMVTEHGVV
jgi:5,10-methenyltetrahydrofolate synthetase